MFVTSLNFSLGLFCAGSRRTRMQSGARASFRGPAVRVLLGFRFFSFFFFFLFCPRAAAAAPRCGSWILRLRYISLRVSFCRLLCRSVQGTRRRLSVKLLIMNSRANASLAHVHMTTCNYRTRNKTHYVLQAPKALLTQLAVQIVHVGPGLVPHLVQSNEFQAADARPPRESKERERERGSV